MRTRRKKSEMPFAEALEAATKRLKHAQKEREGAVRHLLHLDSEIPALQRTIQALKSQLNPSGTNIFRVENDNTLTPIPRGIDDGVARAGIPPEVLALLPADYLQPTVDVPDDTLPEITGTPLIPEEK